MEVEHVRERQRSRDAYYDRVRLSETDLVQLGRTLKDLADKHTSRDAQFELTSVDGEETVKSSNPEMFRLEDLPFPVGLVELLCGR